MKGKGSFTLYLETSIDSQHNMMHEQVIDGPMDFWVHLFNVPVGASGESVALEWSIKDKRDRAKDFFIMGPFNCDGY